MQEQMGGLCRTEAEYQEGRARGEFQGKMDKGLLLNRGAIHARRKEKQATSYGEKIAKLLRNLLLS